MGRPRRGGPSGRCHAWLNLCKKNTELIKLIPIYFSQTSSQLAPVNAPPVPNDVAFTNNVNNSEPFVSPEIVSKAMNTKSPSGEPNSENEKRNIQPKIDRTYDIDEQETERLQQLINHSLIHKSLNMSPIHWKCIPQLHGIKQKHPSAICGVIIKKRRKRRRVWDSCNTNIIQEVPKEPKQPPVASPKTISPDLDKDKELEHVKRERQVKSYLDDLIQDFKVYESSWDKCETLPSELDSPIQAVPYLLDLLWVRPVHLLSHSQLRTHHPQIYNIVDITPSKDNPNGITISESDLITNGSTAANPELGRPEQSAAVLDVPEDEHAHTTDSCHVNGCEASTEPFSESSPTEPMDISMDTVQSSSYAKFKPCVLCHIAQRCGEKMFESISDDLARTLLQTSLYAITLGPMRIGSRKSKRSTVAKDEPVGEPKSPAKQQEVVEQQVTLDSSQVGVSNLDSESVRKSVDHQLASDVVNQANLEVEPTDEPHTLEETNVPVAMETDTLDDIGHPSTSDVLKVESVDDQSTCKSSDPISPIEINKILNQDQLAPSSPNAVPSIKVEDASVEDITTIEPVDTSKAIICEEHDELTSGVQKEIPICGPCLLILRSAIRQVETDYQTHSVDILADLLNCPAKYCRLQSSHETPAESSDQNSPNTVTCQAIPDNPLCQSCLVYECLHLFWTTLNQELSLLGGNLFSYRFTLPVGGPLILPVSSKGTNLGKSLYAHRLSPSDNDLTNPYKCTLCQSDWPSLNYYNLDNNEFILCSGCIWTFKHAYLAATNSPSVRRIAQRLYSAAASMDESLPFLSAPSRRFIVDLARLAQFVSDPCVGNCFRSSSPSTEPVDTNSKQPRWTICPPCTARRCLRLLPVQIPVRPPRWVRRRIKLLCKSKLLEDLDPRLTWPNRNFRSPKKSKISLNSKLCLIDVEFTTAAIQRWLLPPRINTVVLDDDDDDVSHSSSDEDSVTGNFSSSSSGFSATSSCFNLSDHNSDYGSKGWWYGAESPVVIRSPTRTKTKVKSAIDSDTEPEANKIQTQELVVTGTLAKRKRRLTAKAAEALAGSHLRRSRKRSSSGHSKIKLSSEDEELASPKSGVTKTISVVSPSNQPHEETQEDKAIENRESEELVVSLPTSPNKTQTMPDELTVTDEQSSPKDEQNDLVSATEETQPEPESERNPTEDEPVESKKPEQTEEEEEEEQEEDAEEAEEETFEQQPKPPKVKKRKEVEEVPLVRGKRRLKLNHRFIDDYDGDFRSLAGLRRQTRDPSRLSDTSDGSRNSNQTSRSTSENRVGRGGSSSSSSWLLKRQQASQKRARETLNASKRGAMKSGRGHFRSASGKYGRGLYPRSTTTTPASASGRGGSGSSSAKLNSNPTGSRLGPRVKQVSRPSIRPEDSKYSSTLNAMVHAARLAAVGAKVPGGASPVHAALAVTSARSNRSKQESTIFDEADERDFVHTESDFGHRLPNRCGQCPACIGLIQPCGHCANCRSMDENEPGARSQPCKKLICFRRRSYLQNSKAGPRVKLPSNFPSPGSINDKSTTVSASNDRFTSPNHTSRSDHADNRQIERPSAVSLLQTIPNLAAQLEQDAWLPLSTTDKPTTRSNGAAHTRISKRERFDGLHAYSDVLPTPVRGGDLGMHFNSMTQQCDEGQELDRIRPVEGEVIDAKLAHHGGYAVVTTLAAAPPKEICYACGSGGGQLLFCVSCAEPFHFYCVERQFRPRRKDHFICRNCTVCRRCRLPEADLRCVRCSMGYHPDCLADFPPAQSNQRGTWTCPQCTTCSHCGAKPCKAQENTIPQSDTVIITVPWSNEITKCAACGTAESRGDICPECDRAYLPTTKQMVQCDGCRLWMHRTCLKLTADEYELIARMPENQLNKFKVCCTVCQKEQKKQSKFRSSKHSDRRNNTNNSKSESDSMEDDEIDEMDDGVSIKNGKPITDTSYLRNLARETLVERMSNLVNSCTMSRPSDHLSPQSGSHWSPVEHGSGPNSGSGSTSDRVNSRNAPTFNISNELARNRATPTGRFLPQIDGVCDSDSGDDFSFAGVSRTPWPNISSTESGYVSHDNNRVSAEDANSIPRPRGCCPPMDSDVNMSSVSPNPNSSRFSVGSPEHYFMSHGPNQQPRNSNMDHVSSGHSVYSQSLLSSALSDPVSGRSSRTSLYIDPDLPNTHNAHYSMDHNMRRKQNHSSSSSTILNRSGGPPPAPPVTVPWLVDGESEAIWTSPRSLIYRLLIRILTRLSSHPVNSPQALSLRRLLQWLSWITDSYFPWLSIAEMASDVRTIIRQANGRVDAVFKHFEERSVIELHELICPIIARIHELHTRSPNSSSQSFIYGLTNVSNCLVAVSQHLKMHHSMLDSESKDQSANSMAMAKLMFAHSKRSRCYRPHEIENMETMRHETRDDRWVEHWSSIEENMVVRNFQQILYKMFKKRSLRSASTDTLAKIDNESGKCESVGQSPQLDANPPDDAQLPKLSKRPTFYLESSLDNMITRDDNEHMHEPVGSSEPSKNFELGSSLPPIVVTATSNQLNKLSQEPDDRKETNRGLMSVDPSSPVPTTESTEQIKTVDSFPTKLDSHSIDISSCEPQSSVSVPVDDPCKSNQLPESKMTDSLILSETDQINAIISASPPKQEEPGETDNTAYAGEQNSLSPPNLDDESTQAREPESHQENIPETIELTTLANLLLSKHENQSATPAYDLSSGEPRPLASPLTIGKNLGTEITSSFISDAASAPNTHTTDSFTDLPSSNPPDSSESVDLFTIPNIPNQNSNQELKQMDCTSDSIVVDAQNREFDHPNLTSTLNGTEIEPNKSRILEVVPENQELRPQPVADYPEPKLERFYFALDEFWNESMDSEQKVKPFVPPNLHLVDLDEEDELRARMAEVAATQTAEPEDDLSDEEDSRRCLLCAHRGDNSIEGRLLFTGSDTWVHVNCALWSNEVYEEDSGELIGLSDAIRRGRFSCCADCGRYGATLICSNAQSSTCPLHSNLSNDYDDVTNQHRAIHFSCALRRCPPQSRPVFTADRSWFCSPECHEFNANLRISEAIQTLHSRRKRTRSGIGYSDLRDEEDFSDDSSARASSIDEDALASIEESVADDLEPIGLGDLLVCRRVFVPSDCFAASLLPDSSLMDMPQGFFMSSTERPYLMQAAREAVSTLAVSPNSLAFLQCNGLPPSSLVITIGSLRVDRLGEIREASDSLSTSFHTTGEDASCSFRSNFLCPINYRARRIYWSCYKLDARVSYTLHIGQTLATGHSGNASTGDTTKTKPMPVQYPAIKPKPPSTPNPTLPPLPHSSANSAIRTSLAEPVMSMSDHPVSGPSKLVQPLHQLFVIPPLSSAQHPVVPTTATPSISPSNCLKPPVNTNGLSDVSKTLVPVDAHSNLGILNPPATKITTSSTPICIRIGDPPAQKSGLKILNAVSLCPPLQMGPNGMVQPSNLTPVAPMFPFSTVRTVSDSPTVNVLSLGTTNMSTHPYNQGSKPRPKPSIQNLSNNQIRYTPMTNIQPRSSNPPLNMSVQPNKASLISHTTMSSQNVNRTIYLNTGPTNSGSISASNRMPIPLISKPGGVIRISGGTFTNSSRPASLTTPTKDIQLARQLDGLFHNLSSVHMIPKDKPRPISQVVRPSSEQPKIISQLDGTTDDCVDDYDADPDYQVNDRRSSSRRRLTSNSSVSSFSSSRQSVSGRSAWNSSSKRNITDSSRSSSTRHHGRTSGDQMAASTISDSPTSNKRRWIEDRTRQQELANLVSKAKQANHARLYQNEIEKHAQSFRLRFSIDGVVRFALHPLNAWRAVVSRVITLRQKHGLPPLVSLGFDGWSQFGLSHRYVIFLLEQMHGAFHCYRYRFRYHWRRIDRLRQKFTPPIPLVQGCSRAVPWTKPRLASNHARDPLSFLHCSANPPPRPMINPARRDDGAITTTTASKNGHVRSNETILSPNEPTHLLSPNEQAACREAARQAATLVAQQLKLPQRYREACIARAVVQATGLPLKPSSLLSPDNEASQRKLNSNPTNDSDQEKDQEDADDEDEDMGNITTQFSRLLSGPMARFYRVSVHPSRIHGRGLFALRSFREDEMVIEYTGELIRNSVCEARELRYRATGLDCYMFRIDQDWVIDATYAGNAARFINHSCEPNCYAKVITVDDRKHIIILAQRRIYPGEELTYDYRFPKESDKLPCNCFSYSCRKYLN